jgi:hypothetical protein
MPYMLLIIEPVGQRRTRTEQEGQALYDEMLRFSESLKERGLLQLSQSLRSDTEAVRVRSTGGKFSTVDGPFSEAKELVGGFFMLNCEDRGAAIAVARECPAARWATVEVRQLGPCFT